MSITKLPVIGTTCFAEHKAHNVACQRTNCKNWLQFDEKQNCSLIAAEDGPYTLEDIGKIFNLTRMRICQIETSAKSKVRQTIS
jgi:hypothetical protein